MAHGGFTGLKLDREGVGAVLKSAEVAALVNDVAQGVADRTRQRVGQLARVSTSIRHQMPVVVVRPYGRDRAAAVVTVQHFNAVGLTAKYGLLTDAIPGVGINLRLRRAR